MTDVGPRGELAVLVRALRRPSPRPRRSRSAVAWVRRPIGPPRRGGVDRPRARAAGCGPARAGEEAARSRRRSRGRDTDRGGRVRVRSRRRGRHSAIERAVIDRLGDVGAKLHAGRSRNDLVVTDLRLMAARGRSPDRGLVGRLVRALLDARPGACRDGHAGNDARPARAAGDPRASPAGALVGLPARSRTAGRLGVPRLDFAARCRCPRDVHARARPRGDRRAPRLRARLLELDRRRIGSRLRSGIPGGRRDPRTHLSRLAADLARWSDESLGWAELDEAYSTGSSMMPQKRNPDTAELARAKAGAAPRRSRR